MVDIIARRGKTKALTAFPPYRGGEGRLHTCRDCSTAYHYRWELNLTPEQRAKREKQQRQASKRHKAKERRRRAKDARERLSLAQDIIAGCKSSGMSNEEIALRAGINPETITRIQRGTVPRVRTVNLLVELVVDLQEAA